MTNCKTPEENEDRRFTNSIKRAARQMAINTRLKSMGISDLACNDIWTGSRGKKGLVFSRPAGPASFQCGVLNSTGQVTALIADPRNKSVSMGQRRDLVECSRQIRLINAKTRALLP